mmetsp:Transcript_16576/g.35581  ORF Transcript_16576/g.35581 Transcript_16576/m.35581 type:complete len:203 (-) Transcript_16576:198-806(-)|eukprot:2350916-Pleurochrysis_carterae.AAC.1
MNGSSHGCASSLQDDAEVGADAGSTDLEGYHLNDALADRCREDASQMDGEQEGTTGNICSDSFDAQGFLDEMCRRNASFCSALALIPRDGCEDPLPLTVSPAGQSITSEAVEAVNTAFFAGEEKSTIEAAGRFLHAEGCIEEEGHFVAEFKSTSDSEASGGAFAEGTRRAVFLLFYDGTMDRAKALQLIKGLQDYLVEETGV